MATKEETEVQDWKSRINLAESYLRANGRVEKWELHRNYYHNNYSDTDAITVNLIFSIGRALVPQLYFKAPTILVTPEEPRVTAMAPVVESIDKQLITKMGLKAQIKLAIVDAFLTNCAVFKFGYHSISTELPTQRTPNPSDIDALGQAVLDLFGDQGLAEEASKEEEELQQYSYHDWVRPNSPWMLLVQPEDFLVPFGCKNIYEAPWCGFRITRMLADLKQEKVYDHVELMKPNVSLKIARASGTGKVVSPNAANSKNLPEQEDLVELFEIWDKRTGEIIVINQDTNVFHRREKHDLIFEGLPVEMLQFNAVSWDFWGESDVQQIYRQVLELNETRTLEMIHKRTSVAMLGVDGDKVDDTEIAKITKGEKGVFKTKGDPNVATATLKHEMSRDLFNVSDVIRQDVAEILGFSRNQSGEYDVSRRTATEASIVQHSIMLRSDERRDQVGDFVGDAFERKIHPMIFELWDTPRIIEVGRIPKGLPGEMIEDPDMPNWVTFTSKEIKGNYKLTVIADSVVPMTKMERRQVATDTFGMFKGDLRINQRKLYEFVLAQYDGVFPEGLLLSEEDYTKVVLQQLEFMGGAQPPKPAGNGGKEKQPAPAKKGAA